MYIEMHGSWTTSKYPLSDWISNNNSNTTKSFITKPNHPQKRSSILSIHDQSIPRCSTIPKNVWTTCRHNKYKAHTIPFALGIAHGSTEQVAYVYYVQSNNRKVIKTYSYLECCWKISSGTEYSYRCRAGWDLGRVLETRRHAMVRKVKYSYKYTVQTKMIPALF